MVTAVLSWTGVTESTTMVLGSNGSISSAIATLI
jgi:hypothetical protein